MTMLDPNATQKEKEEAKALIDILVASSNAIATASPEDVVRRAEGIAVECKMIRGKPAPMCRKSKSQLKRDCPILKKGKLCICRHKIFIPSATTTEATTTTKTDE